MAQLSSEADFEYLKTLGESRDEKAILNDLMVAYGKDVWNFAFSMLRKKELADDITQDVFLKVYRNLHAFRSEAAVKTWLLTITRNTVFDYRRSAYFRRIMLVDVFEFRGERRSAEQEVVDSEAINGMWEMVMKLPPKYREAIVLFAHHQLSMKEMAEVLGVNEGTVKSRLHHARQKLAKMKERLNDAL